MCVNCLPEFWLRIRRLRLAAYGYNVFGNYVVGSVSQETGFGKGAGGRQRLGQLQQFLSDLPDEDYPNLNQLDQQREMNLPAQ